MDPVQVLAETDPYRSAVRLAAAMFIAELENPKHRTTATKR